MDTPTYFHAFTCTYKRPYFATIKCTYPSSYLPKDRRLDMAPNKPNAASKSFTCATTDSVRKPSYLPPYQISHQGTHTVSHYQPSYSLSYISYNPPTNHSS